MEISSFTPNVDLLSRPSQAPTAETAQTRQVIQAVKTVNNSGVFGQNQVVLLIDGATHLPVIRVEDRETHEVVLQLPAEYVLRLAREVLSSSA